MQENYPNQEDNKPEIVDMKTAPYCWNEECGSDMVYPIDWEIEDGPHHVCTLRCPNCEDIRDAMMHEAQIERFDDLLDKGTDSLIRDLRNLLYANMATEINTFVVALDEDHVVPDDFGIPRVPKEDECDAIIEQAHKMTDEGERGIENRGILSTVEEATICQNQSCESDMVYPTDWEQLEGGYWEAFLRCPNCEDCTMGIMDEELVEKFDCFHDRGSDELARDLRNLTSSNMYDEINVFVRALEEDVILPEDF